LPLCQHIPIIFSDKFKGESMRNFKIFKESKNEK